MAPLSPPLDLVVVGPGRLGRSVAALLRGSAHRVRLVGRGAAIPAAPITWLTVPDRAIAVVARAVPAGGVLLHASGTTDLSPLRPRSPVGSLHPLMSFPGPEHGMPHAADGIPAALAGDPEATAAGRALALALGFTPFDLPGDRRLYHASAVMAGNFATALLAEAAGVLARAGVPADQAPALLAPLALASIRNAAAVGPAAALTGPVSRGDDAVLDGHRAAMREAGVDATTRRVYEGLLAAARALIEQKD